MALQGQAVDIRIHAEEMRRMANRLYEIYSKHTGQPADVIGMPVLEQAYRWMGANLLPPTSHVGTCSRARSPGR